MIIIEFQNDYFMDVKWKRIKTARRRKQKQKTKKNIRKKDSKIRRKKSSVQQNWFTNTSSFAAVCDVFSSSFYLYHFRLANR